MAAPPHRPLRLRWAFALAVILAACGADDPLDLDIGDGNSGVLVPVDGLAVLLNGEVDGDRVCPWGTQPCVTVDQDLGSGRQVVTVAFTDGVATVVQAEPVEDSFRANLVDRCDDTRPESDFLAIAELPVEDQEAAEADGTYAYDTLGQYILTIPDSYAVRWLSNTQRVHLGVVGDAEPHRTALNDLGLGDVVCVAGGFTATDAELERVQTDVGSMLQGWAPRNEGAGWGRDAFAGAVVVDIYEVDAAMLAESEDRFGELVELAGGFVVFNGSLDELHEQLELNAGRGAGSAGGGQEAPGLVASCGNVEFPTMPPDPDALPPLDEEAQAVFDDFLTGPHAVEAEFVGGNDMRIADRTEDTLVLLGIGDDGYIDVAFGQRGGVWSPRSWGGCNIGVSAAGFGSAITALDPAVAPDPASTTLHLTINELNCASGQAPVDRDVLPVVVESDTRIEITTLVAPVPGGADCPGNPWFPVVVELDQPLGERVVVDMVEPPGTELTWPPLLDR